MRRMLVGAGEDGHSICMGDGGGLLPALSGENVPGVQVSGPAPAHVMSVSNTKNKGNLES